jgi:TRAP-type C4-dicarboxylate transport system permease small subunit
MENVMTKKNSSTQERIHHINRFVIVVLIVIGLLIDGYQASGLFILCSSIFWLWLPEIERAEATIFKRKKLSHVRHLLLLVAIFVFVYIAFRIANSFFFWLINYYPAPLVWVACVPLVLALVSMAMRSLEWLNSNNPVCNIEKEPKKVHRHFMVDHKQ